MKIDLSQSGPVIDAADLAKFLELDPEVVRQLMRAGEITSLFETGIDADAGTHRLTFGYGSTKIRLVCDTEGNVLKTSRVKSGSPR